jgi:hypothetical protein
MTYVINSYNLCIWRIFNKMQWEGIRVFTSLPILYVFPFISNMKKAPFVQIGKEMELTVWQHNVTFQLRYHISLLDSVLSHFFLPRSLHYIVFRFLLSFQLILGRTSRLLRPVYSTKFWMHFSPTPATCSAHPSQLHFLILTMSSDLHQLLIFSCVKGIGCHMSYDWYRSLRMLFGVKERFQREAGKFWGYSSSVWRKVAGVAASTLSISFAFNICEVRGVICLSRWGE